MPPANWWFPSGQLCEPSLSACCLSFTRKWELACHARRLTWRSVTIYKFAEKLPSWDFMMFCELVFKRFGFETMVTMQAQHQKQQIQGLASPKTRIPLAELSKLFYYGIHFCFITTAWELNVWWTFDRCFWRNIVSCNFRIWVSTAGKGNLTIDIKILPSTAILLNVTCFWSSGLAGVSKAKRGIVILSFFLFLGGCWLSTRLWSVNEAGRLPVHCSSWARELIYGEIDCYLDLSSFGFRNSIHNVFRATKAIHAAHGTCRLSEIRNVIQIHACLTNCKNSP